jgi:hypothetical protein
VPAGPQRRGSRSLAPRGTWRTVFRVSSRASLATRRFLRRSPHRVQRKNRGHQNRGHGSWSGALLDGAFCIVHTYCIVHTQTANMKKCRYRDGQMLPLPAHLTCFPSHERALVHECTSRRQRSGGKTGVEADLHTYKQTSTHTSRPQHIQADLNTYKQTSTHTSRPQHTQAEDRSAGRPPLSPSAVEAAASGSA